MAHLSNRKLRLIDERKSQGRMKRRERPSKIIDDYWEWVLRTYAPQPIVKVKVKIPDNRTLAVSEALKCSDKKVIDLNEVTKSYIEIRKAQNDKKPQKKKDPSPVPYCPEPNYSPFPQ
jgi:hypothetical protein